MSDISTTLAGCFGLASTRARKERGHFIFKTETGLVRIYKTFERHQAIRQRYDISNKLNDAGFPWTDEIFLSIYGEPFVQLGRETYVMSEYISGREMNLDNQQDILLAMQSLAKFHIAGRGIAGVNTSASISETFESNIAFLTKTVKQANASSRLSDFDVMFIKNIDQYLNYATDSVNRLAKTDYANIYLYAVAEKHLCHNILKEESLPIAGDTCYIINLHEATIDTQITDLANFLRRYARRSNRDVPIHKLIEAYDRISPLPDSALAIINAILVHPWQFVKIARQYYSKKRSWTPIAITSRMASLLEEQEDYNKFIAFI